MSVSTKKVLWTTNYGDDLSLGLYLKEISSNAKYNPLNRADEYELFNNYIKTKCKKIKREIIERNIRYVISVSKTYITNKSKLQDLINEGNIGMIEAIDTFDPSFGFGFITYAKRYIMRQLFEYTSTINVDIVQPASRPRTNKLIREVISDLAYIGIFEPSIEQIIEQYDIIKNKTDVKLDAVLYLEIINNTKGFISSTTKIGDSLELGDNFKSVDEYSADYEIAKNEKNIILHSTLSNILNDREKNVLSEYVGLLDDESKTLEQIAYSLSLTRERTGQILNSAIKKLKPHKKLLYELLGSSIHKYNNSKLEIQD